MLDLWTSVHLQDLRKCHAPQLPRSWPNPESMRFRHTFWIKYGFGSQTCQPQPDVCCQSCTRPERMQLRDLVLPWTFSNYGGHLMLFCHCFMFLGGLPCLASLRHQDPSQKNNSQWISKPGSSKRVVTVIYRIRVQQWSAFSKRAAQ